jgi:hypothetical protein
MLKTLVQFNFYGINERMKDVIGPILSALYRRKILVSNASHQLTNQKNSISNRVVKDSKVIENTYYK